MVEQSWGTTHWQPSWPLRLAAPLAYFSASAVGMVQLGLPESGDRLFLWLSGGLVSYSLFDSRRARRVFCEWLPFVTLVFLYDLLRGHADQLFARAHALPQIWFSRELGHGTVPVIWLQHRLWHGAGDLRWYDYACFAVYISHFFVTPLLAALLWLKAPGLFRRYGGMVLTLAFLGVATYAVFPAIPPWLASRDHLLPPVAHIVPAIAAHVGVFDYGAVFETGERYPNLVAAIPSLHAAYALLAALFLGSLTRRGLLRGALLLYPAAMGFTLVYTGEHYTMDVLLGWLYAAVAFLLVSRLARRRARHPRIDDD